MKRYIDVVEETNAIVGLKLNTTKCSLMVVDKAQKLPAVFGWMTDMERKDRTVYLGVLLTNEGRCEEEIRKRIGVTKTAVVEKIYGKIIIPENKLKK